MAPKLKNVALKKSEKQAIDARVIVSEILSDIIKEAMEPYCGQRLKDNLRDHVLEVLSLESTDISAVGEVEMLISKHFRAKTPYAEKVGVIVTEFLGNVAVGTLFECGDSVVYTGVEQRFNGSQLTRGMHGHVVEVTRGIREGVGVKVHFDRVGRAVLDKRNLVLDGGDKLPISANNSHWNLPAESRRLTGTSVAQHNCGHVWIKRNCPGCLKQVLSNDDRNRVCGPCNAMADKFHADVEVTRDLHAGYVLMKFTLKEFKDGKLCLRSRMGNIDKLIAERKLTKQYQAAVGAKVKEQRKKGFPEGEKKSPLYQCSRQTQNCRGSEASSSHQYPGRPLATAANNAASSADMDRNWREQYQREVYSLPFQYQSPHHEVAQYFWNFSMNALTPIGTGQEEGRGQGRREEEEWLSYQTQATDFRNTETQEIPQPRREAQPESNDCVICCDETSTHAMVPCGHHCVCQACATGFAGGICPICRGEVQGVIHIFRS